ncbi:MAG: TonB-dependent receptor plug domain-containing protein [Bacteroidales bacterium]|nr:TonB-dependent receptor plug domain-containing protein [Bacteroidales bacterium]
MNRNKVSIPAALMLLGSLHAGASAQDRSELDRQLYTSPAALLTGGVSGLRTGSFEGGPQDNCSIYLRGISALRGESSPLWVLDGVPLSSMPDINVYDIESIEVLKDAAATALYGSRGASGVILISTSRPGEEGSSLSIDSNTGLSSPLKAATGLRSGLVHNHSLRLSSQKNKSLFRLSASLRSEALPVPGTFDGDCNVSALFEARASAKVRFGTLTLFNVGSSSESSVADYGQASLAAMALRPEAFPSESREGWMADYDNDASQYRLSNASYLSVNLGQRLSFRADAGIDYRTRNSFIWFGNGTLKGKATNGDASAITHTEILASVRPSLSWKTHFPGEGRLELSAAAELNWSAGKDNNMNGSDFFTHELRAKGLNIAASKTRINYSSYELFDMAAILKADCSFGDFATVSAILRPDWTPRYDDAVPVIYGGINALAKILPRLTLQAGYGRTGSQFKVPGTRFGEYVNGAPEVDSKLSYFYEALDRSLVREWTAGAAFEIVSGRADISARYFRRHSDDSFSAFCFGKKSESSYLWVKSSRSEFFRRSAGLTGSGVEADLNFVLMDRSALRWTLSANACLSEVLVTDIADSDSFAPEIGGGLVTNANVTGQKVSSFLGYLSDSDGNLKDLSGDGRIGDADKRILGNPFPGIFGGAKTALRAGRITAEADFDWAAGFEIADLGAMLAEHPEYKALSSQYVRNGDYLRLARLSLGYRFALPKGCPLKSASISLSAGNLLVLSAYDSWNYNPDCFGRNLSLSGLDYGSYPSARKFLAGIKIGF